MAQEYLSAAAQTDDVAFGISSSAEVLADYGVVAPAVVLFKNFDEGRNDFTGKFDADEILNFVSANSLPLVVAFTQEVRTPTCVFCMLLSLEVTSKTAS